MIFLMAFGSGSGGAYTVMSIHADSKSNRPDSLEVPTCVFFKGCPLFFGMVGGTGSLAAGG